MIAISRGPGIVSQLFFPTRIAVVIFLCFPSFTVSIFFEFSRFSFSVISICSEMFGNCHIQAHAEAIPTGISHTIYSGCTVIDIIFGAEFLTMTMAFKEPPRKLFKVKGQYSNNLASWLPFMYLLATCCRITRCILKTSTQILTKSYLEALNNTAGREYRATDRIYLCAWPLHELIHVVGFGPHFLNELVAGISHGLIGCQVLLKLGPNNPMSDLPASHSVNNVIECHESGRAQFEAKSLTTTHNDALLRMELPATEVPMFEHMDVRSVIIGRIFGLCSW